MILYLLKINIALFRRFIYLLFYSMWKGERGYTEKIGYKIITISTIKGNLSDMGKFTKIFYKL